MNRPGRGQNPAGESKLQSADYPLTRVLIGNLLSELSPRSAPLTYQVSKQTSYLSLSVKSTSNGQIEHSHLR